MASRQPGVFKTTARAASGGVIMVGLMLCLLLFRGFGTGSPDSATSTSGSPQMATTESPKNTETPDPESTVEDESSGGLTPDEQKALSEKVLAVLIDEHQYLLAIPGESTDVYRPTELERVIELARRTEGDSNGIRVRILRRENARASAEEQLKLDLNRAGITRDCIYMPADFVP